MHNLFKTRCTRGQLVIYEDKVVIELQGFGVHNVNFLSYNQITGVDVKTTMAKMLGFGGAATVTIFGTGNQKLEAKMVKIEDAKKSQELINAQIGKQKDNSTSGINDLEKLAELKDKGIITEAEFNQKKKHLLGI